MNDYVASDSSATIELRCVALFRVLFIIQQLRSYILTMYIYAIATILWTKQLKEFLRLSTI